MGSLLLHGRFSSCGKQRLLPSFNAQASHRDAFSHCRAQALPVLASVATARGLGSCGSGL